MESVTTLMPPSVRFAGSHGYRIDGDVAVLNADLAAAGEAQSSQWALQLWACERPHAGGRLTGTKVAEAPIDLSPSPAGAFVHQEAKAPVRLPTAGRDYSMVLVLVSGTAGAFEQVHDFANFPERQPFFAPHFDGAASYAIGEGDVTLRAERISNPRAADNLSGSLALELRATRASEPDAKGLLLATAHLGCLPGQSHRARIEERATFSPPPPGEWRLVLALVEWTALGFATRDACEFIAPYRIATPVAVEAPPVAAALKAPPVAAAVKAPPVAVPVKAPPVAVPVKAPPVAAAVKAPSVAVAVETPDEPRLVSVHTASVDELAGVPGLTRKLAVAIVHGRPFASFEELAKVRGIGSKTVRKLRGLLKL